MLCPPGATAHCLIGVQCTVFTLSDIKGMAMALNHTSVPILRPATTCKFRHCFCVSRNPIPIYTRLLACQAYVCQLLESDSLNLQSGESDHRWRILLSFPTCVNHKLRPKAGDRHLHLSIALLFENVNCLLRLTCWHR